MGWVSGSPKRQLNSSTLGVPSAAIIRPAYRKPGVGQCRPRAGPRSVGSITSRMMRWCSVARDDGCGRIGAHAAGVGAAIAIVAALVILRGGQRHDLLVVRHHDEADFLAAQEFLDHDGVAGGAEAAVAACRVAVGDGRLVRLANHHALAGGEAIGLHHQRQALRAHVAGIEVRGGERRIARGRNAVAAQKFLGVGLGAFELRRGARWVRSSAARPR